MSERGGAAAAAYFATCPAGVADLLATELRACGAADVRELRAGVSFDGDLEAAYRACLWSRTASRVLMSIARVEAKDAGELYDGIRAIDWSHHLAPDGSLAVDVLGASDSLRHTRFTAQRVKDAIVDEFRASHGTRPRVDLVAPDLRLNVRLRGEVATVALDLSGDSLHRRGYRLASVAAPLKENLAAALLLRCGWPAIAAAGGGFVDPLCGSGTLVIEAALIAQQIAPGLLRRQFGFERWRGHDPRLWQRLVEEARSMREAASLRRRETAFAGYDRDGKAVQAASENAARAGVADAVRFERRELVGLTCDAGPVGLIAANPPYGERIGEREDLRDLYRTLGRVVRQQFDGWQFGILTGNAALAHELGMRARRSHVLWNGPIECRLLRFTIESGAVAESDIAERRQARLAAARARPGAQMFANRLRKNLRTIGRWAQREGIDCYRLYDADMPEYAFAIDVYGDGDERWAYVQEYEAPDTIDRAAASARRLEVLSVLPETLDLPPARVRQRVRRAQKGAGQYAKFAETGEFRIVREGRYRFYVNFDDYLDTGLFLDHRPTRLRVGAGAADGRFLNLFAYTGSMTVCAAGGGARSTTSVDLSATYLEWAKRNLALNDLTAPRHEFVRADCLDWLVAMSSDHSARFDLIFLDPPTHSRSKRMQTDFDVQRDHVRLIERTGALLAPDGLLLFSCNYSRFRLDRPALADFDVADITAATIPRDFARNPRVHACFEIRRRGS